MNRGEQIAKWIKAAGIFSISITLFSVKGLSISMPWSPSGGGDRYSVVNVDFSKAGGEVQPSITPQLAHDTTSIERTLSNQLALKEQLRK
jgi:hypothetical protein